MKRFTRCFIVFLLQTAVLALVLRGILALFPTQELTIRNVALMSEGQSIPYEWPVAIREQNTVAVRGVLRRNEQAPASLFFDMDDCPAQFTMNSQNLLEKIPCGTFKLGAINLEGVLQAGDNPFELQFAETDNRIFFDVRSGTGEAVPQVRGLEYQLPDGQPVHAALPIELDLQKVHGIDFILDVPLLHTSTYVMDVRGCIEGLSINSKETEDKYPLCGGSIVDWGDHLHVGQNAVHVEMRQDKGVLSLGLRANPEDNIYFLLQGFMVLAVMAYGIGRFF